LTLLFFGEAIHIDRKRSRALRSNGGIWDFRWKADARYLLIIQLFLDESGYGQTADDQAFIFAGFFGSVRQWEHFVHKWEPLLNEHPVLSAKGFKNSLRRRRPHYRRILKFVQIIKECKVFRISVIIPRKAYENAVLAELPKWESHGLDVGAINLIRNEYYFGFFSIVEALLIPMVELPIDKMTKLEVIYDLNIHERQKLITGYEEFVKVLPEDAARLHGEPRGERDEDFTPLQAADLYALHLHRDFIEKQHGRKYENSVWTALQGLDAYHQIILNESDLRGMARWDHLEEMLTREK
jgi:hypothetical protein